MTLAAVVLLAVGVAFLACMAVAQMVSSTEPQDCDEQEHLEELLGVLRGFAAVLFVALVVLLIGLAAFVFFSG